MNMSIQKILYICLLEKKVIKFIYSPKAFGIEAGPNDKLTRALWVDAS